MLNPRILINLVCICVIAIALLLLMRAQPYLGFSPVTMNWCDGNRESQIEARGQALLVGSNRLTPALYMDYADNGSRLFRRDLHDQVGHNLLSLIYSTGEPASRKLAQDTMEQLHELIRALREEPVRLSGLIAELRQLAEEACRRTGLRLDWNDDTRGRSTCFRLTIT